MAEGEREQDRAPEQMKPKVFVGNHQQMLRDIKQSLKHLTRQPEVKNSQQPSDSAIKTTSAIFEPTNQASGLSNKPMVHNPSRRFSGHARALAEIRSSLKPFEATESGYSSCNEGQSCTQPESINKQVLDQLRAAGVEEVCHVAFPTLWKFLTLHKQRGFCKRRTSRISFVNTNPIANISEILGLSSSWFLSSSSLYIDVCLEAHHRTS